MKLDVDIPSGVQIIACAGSPATAGWTSPVGTLVLDNVNGGAYVSQGAGAWIQLGTGSGGLTQATADARYLQLTGGTLTGAIAWGASPSTGDTTWSRSGAGQMTIAGVGTGAATHINWFASGYESWFVGIPTNSTSFVIGSATTPAILTLGNAGAATFAGTVTANDLHTARDATHGAVYFGTDGAKWLYRHDNVLDCQAMHLAFSAGYGLQSQDNGAQLNFQNGAPNYLQFWTGSGATAAGIVLIYANVSRGWLYGHATAFGLLNDQGSWSVSCNQGAGYGGTLAGSWTVTGNFSVNGQANANTASITNGLACGSLSVAGYPPATVRTGTIGGGIPGDLASGQLWFGY